MPKRSQKGEWAAVVMETWHDEVSRAYGFTPHWEDEGEHRTIMLLGPDSPQEMTLRFHKRWLNEFFVQFLGGEIVLWMDRMGKHWTGAYTTDPDVMGAAEGYRS